MYKREIELSGHIIDSLILSKAFEIIMEKGGDFDVFYFDIGKRKSDISRAKITVSADTMEILDSILDELTVLGASIAEIKEARITPSPKDKVAPEGFYSTTHHVTHVLYKGNWLFVNNMEMDSMIVIDEENEKASCKPISLLKKGDMVVSGRDGIKVTPPERPRGKQGVFEFMNSDVSSEKPLMSIVKEVAREIKEVKRNGGKIALVGGPAIVHTGSAEIIASLIREGLIDVLFAGNALATHDIESNIFGTSLGVSVETGEVVSHGHTHHMRAINRINNSGSIKEAVEDGTLNGGIMYECIKNNIPFVLAGSIRDDGPLPDVITDVVKSQDLMREYVKDVGMVLMISTMLHSIATGNLLPSNVKSVCVDINPSAVTKLSDRGSAQVLGIVTDVGAFLPILRDQLLNE